MEGEYKHSIQKVHNKEYLIKNACYSVTKYYLCKQNNKRSLLGRKQRSQVVRSFPNRYQFSCTNKVTSLFSDRYIFIIILQCQNEIIVFLQNYLYKTKMFLVSNTSNKKENYFSKNVLLQPYFHNLKKALHQWYNAFYK